MSKAQSIIFLSFFYSCISITVHHKEAIYVTKNVAEFFFSSF